MAWDEWEQLKTEAAKRHTARTELNQAVNPEGAGGGTSGSSHTSGDDLHIDPHDAQRIAHKLSQFEHRISSLRSRLKDAGRNTLGTSDLDHACDDFQDRWDDSLKRLKKAASAISGNFDSGMRVYASTDLDMGARVRSMKIDK